MKLIMLIFSIVWGCFAAYTNYSGGDQSASEMRLIIANVFLVGFMVKG